MHNLGFFDCQGEGGEQKLHVNGAAPYVCFGLYLLGTEISSVDEAWLVKSKEQTLYWVQ